MCICLCMFQTSMERSRRNWEHEHLAGKVTEWLVEHWARSVTLAVHVSFDMWYFYWSSVQNIFCSIMVSFLLFRVNFFSFQTFGSLTFNLIALWAEDVDLILFLRKYCDLIHNQFLGVPCIIENNVFSI